jgi:hypothetical protein
VFASGHSNYLMPVKHLREGMKGARRGGEEGRERVDRGGIGLGEIC